MYKVIEMGIISSKHKLDIVAHLPPELVLQVISHLSIKEVCQCTLVSKHWNHVISHLAPYWTTATSKVIGLSRHSLSTIHHWNSPKQFFIAAVSRQEEVRGLHLSPSHIRHSIAQELVFTHCLDARQQCIIRVQTMAETDNSNHRYELVVDRIVGIPQIPDGICSQPVACLALDKQTQVLWASIDNNLLYWVTNVGFWNCYDLLAKDTVFSCRVPLLREDRGVVVTKCKNCSMVVLSFWFPSHNAHAHQTVYIFQAVKLGDSTSMPVQLGLQKRVQRKHCHEVYIEEDSRYRIRNSCLVSTSEEKDTNVCQSHSLILQCDSSIMVHSVHTNTPADNETNAPGISFSKPSCITCDYRLSHCSDNSINRSHNSEISISSDGSLLGQVFNKRLYIWCINKTKNVELVSNSPLSGKYDCSCTSVKLVAVGRLFSIVAYMDNGYLLDYKLQVVHTNTGHVLSEFRRVERFFNWSLCCQIDPLHKFCFLHDEDNWLNDVGARIPSTPVTTVHNHHGRIHMEALQLRATVNQTTWSKHWKCAVNYGLRE